MKTQIFALAFFGLVAVSMAKASLWCPEVDGDRDIFYVNPRNCSSYYICNHGERVLMPCPKGLWWNSKERICDWPENIKRVNCIPPKPQYYAQETKAAEEN